MISRDDARCAGVPQLTGKTATYPIICPESRLFNAPCRRLRVLARRPARCHSGRSKQHDLPKFTRLCEITKHRALASRAMRIGCTSRSGRFQRLGMSATGRELNWERCPIAVIATRAHGQLRSYGDLAGRSSPSERRVSGTRVGQLMPYRRIAPEVQPDSNGASTRLVVFQGLH